MNDFRITEADVGKKFRLRNGDVVTVTKFHPCGTYSVEVAGGERYLSDGRFWATVKTYSRDIVEKLPEEGDGYKDGDCRPDGYQRPPAAFSSDPNKIMPSQSVSRAFMKPKDEWERPTPTMTASDGKQYPVEWFCIPQGYREHLPPTGARILSRCDGDSDGDCYVFAEFHNVSNAKKYGHVWTLVAPSPAVEKVEPQIWDEYFHDVGVFDLVRPDDGEQLAILPRDLPDMSDAIDALYAWKNHILSQEKG